MITAVVPISPIPSHPETHILEETIESIRFHLPDSEIILTFDGVRPEQEERRAAYEEHIRRVLWMADKSWGAVVPFVFDQHLHQTGMLKRAIETIETPLMLYVEQDTPLVIDEPIDWESVQTQIDQGDVDLVRFAHEALILDVHKHLMLGRCGELELTCQWSQRPHVATVAFYRRVLNCFSSEAKAFIEDRMHSVCHEAYKNDGLHGWRQWRLGVYAPTMWGPNIKRSYHLDARAGAPKWDDSQVF